MVGRNAKIPFKDNVSPQKRLSGKSYVHEKQAFN